MNATHSLPLSGFSFFVVSGTERPFHLKKLVLHKIGKCALRFEREGRVENSSRLKDLRKASRHLGWLLCPPLYSVFLD